MTTRVNHQFSLLLYALVSDGLLGTGDGWFKLFDNGYDASSDKWCTDRLIANNGRLSVNLPQGLKGGYYLARPEVVALHNATNGGAQFYTGCAQLFLESTGNLVPEETVSIPGYVKDGEDSVKFNIYDNKNAEYKVPGPAVAKLSASGAQTASDAVTAQTEGLRPEGCIQENANWCGKEVPSYTTESGCWAAGENCWKQADECFSSAPATGNKGCTTWQAKCQEINDNCNAGNFQGPPNKGKDLTPKARTIEVGLVMETVGGGVGSSSPKTSAAAAKPSSAKAEEVEPTTAPAAVTSKAADGYAEPSQDKPANAVTSATRTAAPTRATSKANVPKTTLTISASENAPAPTGKPRCPEGYECVTKVTTEVVTQTQYVTVEVDGYKKRRSLHARRA